METNLLSKEDSIRAEFAEAASLEEKVSFAQTHPDHQLAGLARLQIADARYEEGAYAEAAELYGETAKIFEDANLVSRAVLGQGMSLLHQGSLESGRAVLRTVALDGAALDQIRGEAAYHLAISFWEAGEIESAIEMTDVIIQLDSAPFWVYRANLLRERLN